MTAIKIENLNKVFYQRRGFFKKREIRALKDVSISVNEGEIFGLVGENGAGKTTLIKILANLVIPDSGFVQKDGVGDSLGLILSSERGFYWRLTGRQNLEFFVSLQDVSKAEIQDRIDEMLKIVGLEGQADRWYSNYSSGMKQRLFIARGLLHEPDLVLMDEPLEKIDPEGKERIIGYISRKLVGGKHKTVIYATTDYREAEKFCNRVGVLKDGEIKEIKEISYSRT